MRRKRNINNKKDNICIGLQTKFITEDDIAIYVDKKNGLVISRKINNQDNVDYDMVKLVCLKGGNHVINNFYGNHIKKLKHKVTLILIEADVINLTSSQIEHEKINKIFMWNKNKNHPKIYCLPIGVDKDRHIN